MKLFLNLLISILALSALNSQALSQTTVGLTLTPGKPLRPIWIGPRGTKKITLPGHIIECIAPTVSLFRLQPADTISIDNDENWFQELSVSLVLDAATEENVEFITAQTYSFSCKVQKDQQSQLDITVQMRIDERERFAHEERYVIQLDNQKILENILNRRVKVDRKVHYRPNPKLDTTQEKPETSWEDHGFKTWSTK